MAYSPPTPSPLNHNAALLSYTPRLSPTKLSTLPCVSNCLIFHFILSMSFTPHLASTGIANCLGEHACAINNHTEYLILS